MSKYSIINNQIPEGYPNDCSRKVLNEAVRDFSDEFIQKTTQHDKDYFNKGWRDRTITFIQLGQSELQKRNNNIVLVIGLISLTVALIALFKGYIFW